MSFDSFRILPPSLPLASPEPALRLWEPGSQESPSDRWSLPRFFDQWYVPSIRHDRRRAPCSDATVARRAAAIQWWRRIMGSAHPPDGPALNAITEDDLSWFRDQLRLTEFRRGRNGGYKPLSEVTQQRTLEEVLLVLAAAGPRTGRSLRCGLLPEPPRIYVEPAPVWAKQTWSLDEARSIFAAIGQVEPIQPRRAGVSFGREHYVCVARATLGLWYYTGHRASTYRRVRWRDFRPEAASDGRTDWYLLLQSVKTRKLDKVAVHPHLFDLLSACRGLDPEYVLHWPICWSAVVRQFRRCQVAAGLPRLRQFSVQAWRRLHLKQLAGTGHTQTLDLLRQAAGHSSTSITEGHYFSVVNAHRLLMPSLAGG